MSSANSVRKSARISPVYLESESRVINLPLKKGRLGHNFHFDLGIPRLLMEWKPMVSPRYLWEDTVAAITVACVAIPLGLSAALAAGVNPELGLVTAIIGSFAVGFLGGTPLAVGGPSATMSILLGTVVEKYGFSGMVVVGWGCGVLQLLTGMLGLAKFVRYIPLPVIEGFTAGIGAILFASQLPKAFGIPGPKSPGVHSSLFHVATSWNLIQLECAALSALTIIIIFVLPRFLRRIPAPLVAVVAGTAISYFCGLNVPSVGAIPDSLPSPHLPVIKTDDFSLLFTAIFSVYFFSSLQTLLSSSAVDKAVKGIRHDPDQELIGQGVGNMAISLFGGIPNTGVISRTFLNIQSGAKTRRSVIIHALVLLGTIRFLTEQIERIPIAVLASVLIALSMRMLNPIRLVSLYKDSRDDSLVFAATFITIVFADLITGIQAGIFTALFIGAWRLFLSRRYEFKPSLKRAAGL